MKHQALVSSKDKSEKIQVSSAAILLGFLRVKTVSGHTRQIGQKCELNLFVVSP